MKIKSRKKDKNATSRPQVFPRGWKGQNLNVPFVLLCMRRIKARQGKEKKTFEMDAVTLPTLAADLTGKKFRSSEIQECF